MSSHLFWGKGSAAVPDKRVQLKRLCKTSDARRMPGPLVHFCNLSDHYLVVPADEEQAMRQASCSSAMWSTVTPLLTFPTAWFVKVLGRL